MNIRETVASVFSYLQVNLPNILEDIRAVVAKESPTSDKALVDECGRFVSDLFLTHLGLRPEVVEQPVAGNFLKFTLGHGAKRIAIIGHLDTVWDQGRLSYRVEGNRAYGPGIYDMKSGIIQALWAVKSIQKLALLPDDVSIVFLLNSDEEIGSIYSRQWIQAEALKCQLALVVEPPDMATGALKTSRKGGGVFTIKVHGRAAHAGAQHQNGINAIEELAKQVIKLQQMTDYTLGSTVNVGVIQGGTRFNVVPAYAEAEIDLRIATEAEANRMSVAIIGLEPSRNDVTIEVTGTVDRPPMVRTEQSAEIFQLAQAVADELGFELGEIAVGGTSDGNFTAAAGVPTLDGLGAEGDGAHAEHEHILIDALPKRAALLANLLLRL